MPGRAGHDGGSGPKLRKVQVVVQNLARIVEDGGQVAGGGAEGRRDDYLLQRHGLELGPCDEFVQVVHIALQVLPVVEGQGLGADGGCERIERVR